VRPGEEDTKAVELVLIRRRGGGEDAPHKGGVWKIAYADFMTAMMAFFLVMWLINSTDQKVLTQVANYFNPLRLTDNTPHERGLRDIESGDQGKQGKESMPVNTKEKNKAKQKSQERTGEDAPPSEEPAKDDKQASSAGKARYTEQALFSDPYGVLARIATDATSDAGPQATVQDAKAYHDPFDPAAQRDPTAKQAARSKAASAPDRKAAVPATGHEEVSSPRETEVSANTTKDRQEKQLAAQAAEAPKALSALEHKTVEQREREQASIRDALKAIDQAAAAKAAEGRAAAVAEATRIDSEIRRMLSQFQGTIPNIDVTVTEEGVLISLTDDTNFGMFAIASAEPRPAMVVVMERIAKIVQAHQHPLIVRGHTDARPYRSGTYDNWRLSTARAHMAYYMLVRGGIDEKRFERVEGYADRSLRIPADPEAAQNRRIEILLRRPKL